MAENPARNRGGPSLKARAIGLLSRREHSRSELRRKLAPHCEDPATLETLLDELERGNWLSQERFAESIVNRRAAGYGTRRILQELRRHEVPDETLGGLSERLRSTEQARAQQVWLKRFGSPPSDAREHAKQYRYMAARGFSPECLRRILAEQGSGPGEDLPPFDPLDA